MQEDLKRRKRIKRITNYLGVSSVVDSLLSFALLIYLMRNEELASIPVIIACMQISNHEFLVLISSVLLLQTGNKYFDRIDACGAWMVIHFLVAIGNTSFVTFEIYDDINVIINASWYKKTLLIWKAYFILVQLFGIFYCYYVVHKPVAYIKPKRTNHPLFNGRSEQQTEPSTIETRVSEVENERNDRGNDVTNRRQYHGRPQSAVFFNENPAWQPNDNVIGHHNHGYNRNSCYESYQSLTRVGTDTPVQYTRNPAYESELSLDYANNYSPYDQMMLTNRNRLSYVEPISETAERAINYGTVGRV